MLDWFRGKKITINIYDEKQDLTLPTDFKQFVKAISNQLQINPDDCTNNLVFKYNENKLPRFFANEKEYQNFMGFVKNSKRKETVFIEFNEKTAEIIRQSLAFNEKNNKVEIKDTNLSLLIRKSIKNEIKNKKKKEEKKKIEPIKEENSKIKNELAKKEEPKKEEPKKEEIKKEEPKKEEIKKEEPKKEEIKKEEPKKEEIKKEESDIIDNIGMEEKIVEPIKSIEVIEQNKQPTVAELLGFEELDINELNEDENNIKESDPEIVMSPEKEQEIKSVWNIFSFVNKIPGVGGFFKKNDENESNENKEDNQIE